MLRHRLTFLALAAGLGLLQGCTSCDGLAIGNGQLLQRLGFGSRSSCDCMTVSSGGMVLDGGTGQGFDGPALDPQGQPNLPPYGTEPPLAPTPRTYPPFAQPAPAPGTTSRVKTVDPTQK